MKTDCKKTAVIVGCSQMGAKMAMVLCHKGYKVVVVDKNYNAFEKIDRGFRGTEFLGDGTDIGALRSLGVDNICVFVAATSNDAENIAISESAGKLYHLDRAFAVLKGKRKEKRLQSYNLHCPVAV